MPMAIPIETRDYANFDPYVYDEINISNDITGMKQDLDCLHDIFNNGKVTGKRLLDVGTGPTIHTVISASDHVDEILLSDYTPQNRQYLEKWRNGEIVFPKLLMEHVVNLEGRHLTPEQRENEVREKVKGILTIDVTSEQPFGYGYSGDKFDIVISSHCIDEAVDNIADLTKCMRNVSTLINESGYMIISCDIGATYYLIGKYKFTGASFTREEVETAMKEADFDIGCYAEIPNHDDGYNDAKGYYYLTARKRPVSE